jgi:hypothetical protein
MAKSNDRLIELSSELDEHIIAVKGTLELVDSSVTEDDLHDLLLKAIVRMDTIQRLSHEMIVALKNLIDKIDEIKSKKADT